MTLGLFIGRFNPPHIGHLSVIDNAIKDNEKVLLLVGISGKRDLKNPLSFLEIKKILLKKYKEEKKIFISYILDTPDNKIWVQQILGKLDRYGNGIKDINFYGGDFKNDSAFNVVKQYSNLFVGFNIKYIEYPREKSYIEYKGKKILISSTNLKKSLVEKNFELSEKFMDKKMIKEIESYFKF